METTHEYYHHARRLGAFSAEDCLELARQAAALDQAAATKKIVTPMIAWHEVLPDGSSMLRASDGITVY
jgi:hypothetical protein